MGDSLFYCSVYVEYVLRAVILEKPGEPEVLAVKEVSDPEVGGSEVLIRVKAIGVNRIDIWVRSGVYKVELPRIIGVDAAGVVEKVGREAEQLGISPGDRVVVDPALYDDVCSYCASGFTSLCENHKLLGFNTTGTYAELLKIPARNVYRIPENLSFEEAAAIPVNFLTSWHALFYRGRVKAGDYVLVVGGGSGVGYAATQLAKLAGATVITTVGDEWKIEKAREVGADYVINRRKEDVVQKVMEYTDGKGVDLVFEHAGRAVWSYVLNVVKPGGSMVFCGATTGDAAEVNIRHLYRRQINLIGSYGWNRDAMHKVINLFKQKRLKTVIDSVMKLEEAPEAHRRMENSRHFGKIILTP